MSHDPTIAGEPAGPGAAPGSPPAADPAARIAELEAKLAAAEAEASGAKDQALRALAEAENTRRRIQREAEEREKFALSGFARELVGGVDNLRRALETLPGDARTADARLDQFAQGVELTEREFMAILERNGIKRVHPQGQAFDHNLHQAIAQAESADQAPGTILQVVQSGYTLHGRILRPALVVVAKAKASGSGPGAAVDTTA
ncbi:MAG: nucleotide exchange factor GrpE [Rhodospirillales bacterium]